MSTNRRLMVRITTQCNSGCAHCTIADIAHHTDRTAQEVVAELAKGRQSGCTELVFMRGEALIRKDLLPIVRKARELGYTHIQLQTNARLLSYSQYIQKLNKAGMTFYEVSFFGHSAGLHDAIDGTEGAFAQASAGIKNLAAAGAAFMVSVPVLKRNFSVLTDVVDYLHSLGVTRVQLQFPRPVQVGPEWQTKPLIRLSHCSSFIRKAMARGKELGLAMETEGVPLCHLDESDWNIPDADTDFTQQEVADVHRHTDSVAENRDQARPRGEACNECVLESRCPTTWAAYQALYGTWEFKAVSA